MDLDSSASADRPGGSPPGFGGHRDVGQTASSRQVVAVTPVRGHAAAALDLAVPHAAPGFAGAVAFSGVPLDPPTATRLLGDWAFDPASLMAVLLAALAYAGGVRRLKARGRRWGRHRSASFGAGLATIAFALQSGLARYDTTAFSVHAAQHLLLTMVAPPLLAMGAPLTLALQASRRSTRRALLSVLHSPPLKVLTHPLVAWILFTASFYGLYFSPLFELSLTRTWAHVATHAHLVGVGALFWWVVVGLDPGPRRLSHPARMLYVFLMLPFHAFLGIAVMSSNELLAPALAGATAWGGVPLADQRTGGGILWAAGDLIAVISLLVLMSSWMNHETRQTARRERFDDARARDAAPPADGALAQPARATHNDGKPDR